MQFDEVIRELEDAAPADWLRDDAVGVFTLRSNINMTIHEMRGERREPFEEPWVTGFAKSEAKICKYDLYYGASFLKRYYCVSIDGGRAIIPYPKSKDELTISREQFAIGIAINLPPSSFDEYLNRCGITVL